MEELVYAVIEKDADWVSPLLWKSEFRNVVAMYLRKDIIELPVALQAVEEAEELMKDTEFEVKSTQILSLVSESTCSSYDCEFVALAADLNLPLVTFDQKILNEFSFVAIHPKEFIKN